MHRSNSLQTRFARGIARGNTFPASSNPRLAYSTLVEGLLPCSKRIHKYIRPRARVRRAYPILQVQRRVRNHAMPMDGFPCRVKKGRRIRENLDGWRRENSREKNFSRGVFRAWSPWLVCQRPGYVTNERLTVAMPEMGFVCSGWEEKQRVGVNSISILGSRLTTNERLKFEQSREWSRKFCI